MSPSSVVVSEELQLRIAVERKEGLVAHPTCDKGDDILEVA